MYADYITNMKVPMTSPAPKSNTIQGVGNRYFRLPMDQSAAALKQHSPLVQVAAPDGGGQLSPPAEQDTNESAGAKTSARACLGLVATLPPGYPPIPGCLYARYRFFGFGDLPLTELSLIVKRADP